MTMRSFTLVMMVVIMSSTVAKAQTSEDLLDCAETLMTMTTCIPYVSGKSAIPTKNCCSDLDKVVDGQPKCLCVLIKDHDDPLLESYEIDLDNAVALPAECKNNKANISLCPGLLDLNPDSPAAQIFKDYANSTSTNSSSDGNTTTTPTPSSPKIEQPTTKPSFAGQSRFYDSGSVLYRLWAIYCFVAVLISL